jgi:hypothetical protein
MLLFVALLCTSHATRKAVHGVVGRDVSLKLLQSKNAVGRFRSDLLAPRASMKGVLGACWALRDPESFSILQMRECGACAMYICAPTGKNNHKLVAILATTDETPLWAAKKAMKWHASTFPYTKLTL